MPPAFNRKDPKANALMDHARTQCVCGCYVNIDDILGEALKLKETRQGLFRQTSVTIFAAIATMRLPMQGSYTRLERACSCFSRAVGDRLKMMFSGLWRR